MNRKPPADNSDWLSEISTVKPLGSKQPHPPQGVTPKSAVPTPARRNATAGWNTHTPFPVISNTAECISGVAPNLEKRILKELAHGRIHPTAVLDLHGLGEGDAWLELMDFLHTVADAGHRCALVVHGKGQGYGPKRDMGVIKFQIGGWLAGHPKVLAFTTALPVHGGTGAIYVYLRRRRI